ncbi:MAG: hypothetical protein ACRC1M_02390 [Methanobacteriaceae archaeon]
MTTEEKREAYYLHKEKYYKISYIENQKRLTCAQCVLNLKKIESLECMKKIENSNFYKTLYPQVGFVCDFLLKHKEVKLSKKEILELKILNKFTVIEVDLDEI